ncbi:hypothetical protein M3223_07425 [Paenibacillus pasadenensis]|uniref:hypothetical protein n=1 Tax=Paenibacillus pasadenensis TaxID=217090 RepID=UPI00203FDFDD|nr:hypothetical protein [Paenibacillus pasadenensis]MCM3747185.1 hypothetical protein [Paenibacillus pasadenensis]
MNRTVDENLLDEYRQSGEKVRVVRDEMEQNDVVGIVVAWDDDSVMIRRPNKRVVKLSRSYSYQSASSPRIVEP